MRAESSAEIAVSVPPAELFNLLCQTRLRYQLAPDWGEYDFLGVDPDFPAPGSAYRLQLKQPLQELWEIAVEACEPPRRLLLASRQGPEYRAEWLVEPLAAGCRLRLEEQIKLSEPPLAEAAGEPARAQSEDLESMFQVARQTPPQVRQKLVAEWVGSIGRYADLPNSKLGRGFKWLMDRYLLRLRAEQRRVMLILLAIEMVMFLAFVAAAIGLGLVWGLLR